MKRFLAAAFVLLIGLSASAQLKVGAGYVSSTTNYKFDSYSIEAGANGFYVGGSYNIPLGKVISFDPGLTYEFLSYQSDFKEAKSTEHYLNAPLNFQFTYQVKPTLGVFAFAGPTLQLGLAANWKLQGEVISTTGSYYGNNSTYGRFDTLVGGGLGVNIMNCIQIRGAFNYGLVNRDKTGNDGQKHRREFTVGLAYMF